MSVAFAAKSMAPSRPVMPPRPLIGTTFRDRLVITGMVSSELLRGNERRRGWFDADDKFHANRQDRDALER
jgi:hypothetical protein